MAGFQFKAVTLVVLILFQWGCRGGQDHTLPLEMLGTWGTTASPYLDCSFELKPDVIIFNNGVDYTSVNRIVRVERRPDKGKTVYEITYVDKENFDYKLSLFYFKGREKDVIRFKNQKNVSWTRKLDQFLSSK